MGRIAMGVLAGVCLVHTLSFLPAGRWAVLLATALCLAIWRRAVVVCAVLAGIAWAWSAASLRLAQDLPTALEGEDLDVSGYIASLPEAAGADVQFLFDVATAPRRTPGRVQLSWYRAAQLPQPGEMWRFTIRVKRRNGFANPGGFDYERKLFHEGVGAVGYVRDASEPERLRPAGLRYPVLQLRQRIAERLSLASGSHAMLGVVQGLTIGDTRQMNAAQWRVFSATGTAHLMAISGLHISMIAALAAWLGGALVRRAPWAQARGWSTLCGQVAAGVAAAVLYSLLAGMSLPTQRTLIMLAIYFFARWRRRELAIGQALGMAVLGVLLFDPFAPLAPGAWLSFGAVALIVVATSGRLRREHVVRAFGRVQLALTVGLIPVLVVAFGAVSLISPLANAFAVPLFTLAVAPTALIGALAACISIPAGELLLTVPLHLLEWSWPLLERLAVHPLALWRAPEMTWPVLVALGVGVGLFAAPGPWPLRVTSVLLCLPALVNRPPTPPLGEFSIAVLDVGQGLATVVRTQAHTLVFDVGPSFQSGRDTGELVVAPYLFNRGVMRVDALLISHGDLDHRGGARSLMDAMQVVRVLRGPSVKAPAGLTCAAGQLWTWDEVHFEVLHPAPAASASENDSSCVLRVSSASGSALLTGDIEGEAEAQLVAAGLAPADVVIAPHHGSRTSSTAAFTAALKPRVVVFSTGYRNRWGFPRQDVVERWRAQGAALFDTARSGAVEVAVRRGGALDIVEHRRADAHYWRR